MGVVQFKESHGKQVASASPDSSITVYSSDTMACSETVLSTWSGHHPAKE